ncbi:serine/threonine-protein kinase [Micromonospora zamorensis]|uniref:serine/threonine-protein kinase n=1 Tax=Micromonospora zamorensis TaxID=709883 RepID=UPI003D99B6CB
MPYEKIKLLGSGEFGEVWLERDEAVGRLCAAKYIDTDSSSRRDAFREAQWMSKADHENVVKVYSADETDGCPVIRMEYLERGSVADLYDGRPAPVAEAARLIEEACRGVQYLHSLEILHRDIKPANLLLTGDGRVKVSDFGLAGSLAALDVARPIGYSTHLPPESVGSSIRTKAGDVYALGMTLYRILNGDVLLPTGNDFQRMNDMIREGKYPDRTSWRIHIHDGMRRVVRKALHVSPAGRFLNCSDFRRGLEKVRPLVSWQGAADLEDAVWNGFESATGHLWRAGIEQQRKSFRFSIEKTAKAGQYRSLRTLNGTFETDVEARRHARDVFEQTATGRYR